MRKNFLRKDLFSTGLKTIPNDANRLASVVKDYRPISHLKICDFCRLRCMTLRLFLAMLGESEKRMCRAGSKRKVENDENMACIWQQFIPIARQ